MRSHLFGKGSKLWDSCYSRHVVLAVIRIADGEDGEITWPVLFFPDAAVVWVVRGVPDVTISSSMQ